MSGGLLGFLVILALGVGAVFLFRSMNTHLRRVPPTFDEESPPQSPPPPQSSPRD
jgi:hypothetical protein